ncbi:AAA family ATPase [Methylovulum psychrotolerans]|uniref:Chromosome segregation protein SMC n=1 Tax=Methylovulum psychrotolerans TaxID=1704499 RepID=A0A1Z4BU73_9GAMM|nr:AAA family ATPase [Methylovulum psychrotolerans]ASF44855.1 chromosome segregation protein SMC [Methylovulum psychrotolerans]
MSGVSSLTIMGYKSIRELRDFPLNNLNVLIGANGAGKSNFIGFFRLLAEIVGQNLQVYVQKQGGPDALLHFGRNVTNELSAEINYAGNAYRFGLIPTNDNRLIFLAEYASVYGSLKNNYYKGGHDESALKTTLNPYGQQAAASISNWRVYHFHDTGDNAKVKQRHAVNDTLRLKSDAANLAAYLRMLYNGYPSHYQRIVDTIRLVAPFFGDFVQRPGTPDYIELEWTQKGQQDTPFKAHVLSDGTLRFICLATLLLQPEELLPDTILIDEPELGLHPYAISILADIFKQVAETKQLIVSTQSVELVNELSPEDVIVVDQENDASVFKRFSS